MSDEARINAIAAKAYESRHNNSIDETTERARKIWAEDTAMILEAVEAVDREARSKYKDGGRKTPDHLTRAFLKTGPGRTYVASTISPRLSRQDILDALTDHGSTFPKAYELLDERDDRIRKNAAWRALADAADAMPGFRNGIYDANVREWLQNRAKDAFRGGARE